MTEAARLAGLARYLARKTVMDHLRNKGIRWLELEPSEIRRWTDVILMVRKAELIAKAQAILDRGNRKQK